ncbi:lytic murein transglycosylase [Tropicibacter naphthalenivorans]|uniref:Membrane-bound lytic murein transglycosylase B n=1 Tax=Tropicibacter naphthalenivorans TaxID=441103 RepID=A0A0N7LZU0_9RHOB|nr:lytic murein transglycosylase [Tropicibacter naphthalenivorans]CUH78601.1 Membrane-bound lytic murein transglycosylase B precursor [Tropicibacter naphthalenivorans]SMC81008.1 lytic murein transglycosylase [Tropicibacter naphthalenivorans]
MVVTRRVFTLGLSASVLSGCVAGGAPQVARPDPALEAGLRPQPNASYDAWVAAFRNRAKARGITEATLRAAFRGQGYLPGVIERDRNQTEFKRSLEDYLAIVAPEDKVTFGKRAYAQQQSALRKVEAAYGVQPEVLAAIWGLESYFGTKKGKIPVISATSTLAWEGRRGRFFESNLMDALRIVQSGDAQPSQLVGSWAGAMGHTQLIPNAYQANAVDFDKNGKRDIWSNNPIDAFATTARFLSRAGWRRGGLWGLEVRVPDGYSGPVGRSAKRSVADWRAAGVRPAAGGSLPDHGAAGLLAPMGLGKPTFLVFRNFDMILRYNPSENYGLGVGYMASRLAGGGPLRADFGPDRYGLTLEDRKALQKALTRKGFDAGTPDGVIGKKTEAAIAGYQRATGLPVTGKPSAALLRALT